MKLILVLLCLMPQITSAADCRKEETRSLWVEQYDCPGNIKISKGHELFNDSLVVEEPGKVQAHYLYQNDKVNTEYFKAHRLID